MLPLGSLIVAVLYLIASTSTRLKFTMNGYIRIREDVAYHHHGASSNDDGSTTTSSFHSSTSSSSSSSSYLLRKPRPLPTLAHYDPYFVGGFRNQHMRFVSFVHHAVSNNISQILLPSLRWMGHYNFGSSILHELLFDVEYWNDNANEYGLPLLVDYDMEVLEGMYIESSNGTDDVLAKGGGGEGDGNDESSTSTTNVDGGDDEMENENIIVMPCWNASSGLFVGLDESILRNPNTNIRRTEVVGNIGIGMGSIGNVAGTYAHCRCGLDDDARRADDGVYCRGGAANDDIDNRGNYRRRRYTRLIPHGGSRGAGRLWNDYNAMQGRRRSSSSISTIIIANGTSISIYPEHVPVERAVLRLLRPSERLRSAMEDAIDDAMRNATTVDDDLEERCAHGDQRRGECERDGDDDGERATITTATRVLALHPRVEPEMLRHRCARHMESNLTTVFERIQHMPDFFDAEKNEDEIDGGMKRRYKFDMVFVAVSKSQILGQHSDIVDDIGIVMNQNRNAFLRAMEYGLFGGGSGGIGTGIPIFVSGTDTAANVKFSRTTSMNVGRDDTDGDDPSSSSSFVTPESLGVLELVASIINFFTAVRAGIFVGVRGSSFSTDVFSVRYYQHGELGRFENYILGRDGIRRLYGPPPPHSC